MIPERRPGNHAVVTMMVASMNPGSVIVDMAAKTAAIRGTVQDRAVVTDHGVTIIG